MRTMRSMNEAFIKRAERSVITPRVRTKPIMPTDRWVHPDDDKSKGLSKTFKFQNNGFRDRFVIALFEYEEHYEHRGVITVSDLEVNVTVVTKNIDIVTELDEEYCRFCDTLYRDVVYDFTDGSSHRFE